HEGLLHTLLRHLLWLGLGIRVLEAQLYPTAAADVNTRQFSLLDAAQQIALCYVKSRPGTSFPW
ncbi:MAG TPA: hypothetical protein VM783_16105, partial [Candidatus Acidoferrum sp.]|nr:hypothetical protein [Candidatus Acidoferrum sp.]